MTFKTVCEKGDVSCDDALHSKLGHRIVGFDFKYSLLLFEQPFNLYIAHKYRCNRLLMGDR